MKKLPEITMNDWLEAEQTMKRENIPPRPEGITVDEYAQARCASVVTARRILLDLFRSGKATRARWCNGNQSGVYVYQLKK